MSTKTKTKTDASTMSVADAEAAAEAARKHDNDLNARLEGGELSITADDLEDARKRREHAERMLKGVRAAVKQAEESRLRDEAAEHQRRANKRTAETTIAVDKAANKARKALTELAEAVREANQARIAARADYETFLPSYVPADTPHTERPDWFQQARPERLGGELDALGLMQGIVVEILDDAHRPASRSEQAARIQLRNDTKLARTRLREGVAKAREITADKPKMKEH